MKNIKTIELGTVNDATVYAINNGDSFTALLKEDLEFTTPDLIIKCDSGVYPGTTSFEQYICDKAYEVVNG